MKTLILGMDGYLGWSLALHLAKKDHKVVGVDNFYRRKCVEEMGSKSAMPILPMEERLKAAKKWLGVDLKFHKFDIKSHTKLLALLTKEKPDTIVHFAEQPSAPYSMIDVHHATETQNNNIMGTLNLLFAMKDSKCKAHLVKLGTMGEYGTPNLQIPEGFFKIKYKGREDTLPFPKQAGSWYHWTKVHDSGNIQFACKIWGLKSTDIMQGVVYGTRTEEMIDDELLTRFDYDEAFGTVINRYCAQAVVGIPLAPYGRGGQTRGFIALRDSMQCLTLAIENPPEEGEYRVFNQFDETYNVTELAERVKEAGDKFDLNVKIENIENPRIEQEKHYYEPIHHKLKELGFKPTQPMRIELKIMLADLLEYKKRIKKRCIMPKIRWKE